MAVRIPSNQIKNPQQLEVVVAGPEDANRLIIINGQFDYGQLYALPNSSAKELISVLVGPTFKRKQFLQANAAASLAGLSVGGGAAAFQILNVDADWDDESGQVELTIEVGVSASEAQVSVETQPASILGFAFQVTILAAMP